MVLDTIFLSALHSVGINRSARYGAVPEGEVGNPQPTFTVKLANASIETSAIMGHQMAHKLMDAV
jgi:hypothetical protein